MLAVPDLDLTDDRWARIIPLLPPPSRFGRPATDHRPVLAGMLWIIRTGASWRELPARFGSWHTVYTRYHQWHASALWQQILAVLNPADAAHDA